jgi:hypothetical protein
MPGVKNYLDYEIEKMKITKDRLGPLAELYTPGSLPSLKILKAVDDVEDAISSLSSLRDSDLEIPSFDQPAEPRADVDYEQKFFFRWLYSQGFTANEIGKMFGRSRQMVRSSITDSGRSALPKVRR